MDNTFKEKPLKNLTFLSLFNCNYFMGNDLKGAGLEKVQTFHIKSSTNFRGKGLATFKKANKITITNCNNFDPNNLKNLDHEFVNYSGYI